MTTESTPRAGTAAAAADDHERFQIHDRLEILGLVRTLVQRRALVSVVYGGGSGFFVSALLQVSSASGEIIVDGAPDLPAHEAALASPRLTFATLLDNIRIQFHADGAADAEFEGQRALRVALPETVLRLQRRADYRLRIPPAEAPVCELRGENSAALPLRVYDISVGGIALVDWPDGRTPENHRIYRQCRLLLEGEEPIAADLEVVYVLERTESDGQRVRRCGARFVDLPGTLATRVQRYINRLERRQRALREPQGNDRR